MSMVLPLGGWWYYCSTLAIKCRGGSLSFCYKARCVASIAVYIHVTKHDNAYIFTEYGQNAPVWNAYSHSICQTACVKNSTEKINAIIFVVEYIISILFIVVLIVVLMRYYFESVDEIINYGYFKVVALF